MRYTLNFSAAIAILTFISCNRSEPYVESSNMVVYENEDFIDLTEQQTALQTRIYVENASPYEEMMGYVSWEAFSATIGGNDVRVSDIKISNIKLQNLELYCPYDADSMLLYLESVDTYLEYFGSNGVQTLKIGSMILVDVANTKVRFLPTEEDLTTFMENKPDKIYFDMKFRFKPHGPLNIKYRVAFSYDYYYESSEDKM